MVVDMGIVPNMGTHHLNWRDVGDILCRGVYLGLHHGLIVGFLTLHLLFYRFCIDYISIPANDNLRHAVAGNK